MTTLHRSKSFVVFASLFYANISTPQLNAQDFGQIIRTSDPLSPEDELETFTVPDGFEVSLFASEPEIQKPMNLAFDAKGRLWVSGSNDYPFPNLDGDANDSIRVLEDTDGDGRADKVTTFVEGITIPIGLYPYQDGVIAFAIPNIVHYRDTDGDGKSDTSQVLYGPFDFTRDTHGLNNAFRRGLDGWIYACHGFNNNSEVSGTDGNTVSMSSGNTYRFKIDGSRIEHFTHGQVNPFGMTFDQYGDVYTSDCHTKPITLLIRGGYYESFGKPHDGLGYVPPVMEHLHGSTAIGGISQITGTVLPPEYRHSLFVGNVMTSRVHRDTIDYTGSSAKAIEQGDFLISSDSWFRPVDTQCGPDGALYVADFYNRIIGHYEVPLDHPGRDRFRGRIWRVSYVANKDHESSAIPDLTTLNAQELIKEFDRQNLTTSYRAVEQLVDRIGQQAVPTLKETLEGVDRHSMHYVLWTLHRLGKLTPLELDNAMNSPHEPGRVHVQRILEATSDWTPEHQRLAKQGLNDQSGLVRRASAGAFAAHSEHAELSPLLNAYSNSPEDDVHLRHAIKIALKSHLRETDTLDSIDVSAISEEDAKLLANVSLAVETPAAANFLMEVIDRVELADTQLQSAITMAARHSTRSNARKLIELTRTKFSNNPDQQLATISSIEAGLRQRGEESPDELAEWGRELIRDILTKRDAGLADWSSLPLGSGKSIAWNVEQRNTEDEQAGRTFLSSLPAGERAVGILQSKTFEIPETLTFYVCGHLGFPNQPAIEENRVSLHLASDHSQVTTVFAPRDDTARKIVWDLSEFQGQQGYLKIVDGIDIRAYAWIAVSRFEPPVVRIPETEIRQRRQRLVTSAELAGRLQLENFVDEFSAIGRTPGEDGSARYAALTYVATAQPSPHALGLLALFAHESVTGKLADDIAQLVVKYDDPSFQTLMTSLPLRLQTVFARYMSQMNSSARELAGLIAQGIVSPEVLRSEVVKGQLAGLSDEALRARFSAMHAALPDANDKIGELIARFTSSFDGDQSSISNGKAAFMKHCSACHSIAGEGKKIGPQLDGIGNRGLERVLEDVLAPNRNIDLAFRSRTYALENGKVFSGLFRREEGKLIVIADSKGEEISFNKDEIDAERVSPISIMPENWGDVIPPQEFRDLLGFLLAQRLQSQSGNN